METDLATTLGVDEVVTWSKLFPHGEFLTRLDVALVVGLVSEDNSLLPAGVRSRIDYRSAAVAAALLFRLIELLDCIQMVLHNWHSIIDKLL